MVFSVMLVKKARDREPLVEKSKPNMHEHDDVEDVEEDTLSFCEFSINSDADVWEEDSSRESQNSSFKSSEEDERFEFSQELSKASTIPYPPENIIFCGKLISYKQPASENTKKFEKIKQRKHKTRGFFRWKWNFGSSHKTKISRKNASKSTGTKGSCSMQKQEKKSSQNVSGSYKTLAAPERSNERCTTRRKRNKQHDLSVHKMSFFTSTRKSRWYLFLFGITKFKTEMELRDMKNRQSRRRSPSFSLFRLEGDEDNNNTKSACIHRSRGFWAVLRALSCGGEYRPTAVVKASSDGTVQV